MDIKAQTVLACVLLLILGYVYGAQKDRLQASNCATPENITATLSKTISLGQTQARYMFTSESGCLILVYAPRFPVLIHGTKVKISGKQETPQVAFASLVSYAKFLENNGVSLVVRNAEILVLEQGRDPLDIFRVGVASRIATVFREPDASLINAMLAGDQGMISKEIQDIYRKSGITHILSISGLHVSIIALVLTASIGLLRVSPIFRSLLIFTFLWTYIVSVGSPASAVRAGFFWTCFILAYHVRALVGILTVILVTLAALLTYDPDIAGGIGFQLSVAAVCGIGIALFFLQRIHISNPIKGVLTLLAVSVGATIAIIPLTLFYFGNFSLVGFITNILVVPLLPVITYVALLALLLYPFFVPLALVCSFVVHMIFSWILFVSTLCASIPYGHFENISFPGWGIALYYSLLVLGIMVIMKRFKISWRQWWI